MTQIKGLSKDGPFFWDDQISIIKGGSNLDAFTTSDGSRIMYKTMGKGKPIVFIHGWSVEYRLWFNQIESIKGNWKHDYQRIYFDLPGMGVSVAGKTIKQSDQMLKNIEEFLDYIIKGQSFILAGESYGGYLARGLLLERKKSIDGLFLLCPLVIPGFRMGKVAEKQILEKDEAFLDELSAAEREEFEYLSIIQNRRTWTDFKNDIHLDIIDENRGFLETQLDGSFSFDISKEIPYDRPVLVLLGRQDTEVGFEDQYELYKTFSRAAILILDKAGHNLQFERPHMLSAAFLDLLERIETFV